MLLAVTSPRSPSAADLPAAAGAAARHGLRLVRRGGDALPALAAQEGVDGLLVVGAHEAALWLAGRTYRWRAGMGDLRLRRVERGERATPDRFLEAASLRAGDAVLDATLGLGMDALVAACAVGLAGRVLGVEASVPLAALVTEGLARHRSPAAARVEVVCADAEDLLRSLPARSFDVVAFDPMYAEPKAEAAGFDLVRRLGVARPLARETLERAREVARRWVVVKDGAPGRDLARLGLVPLPCSRSATRLYARIPAR